MLEISFKGNNIKQRFTDEMKEIKSRRRRIRKRQATIK